MQANWNASGEDWAESISISVISRTEALAKKMRGCPTHLEVLQVMSCLIVTNS
jgi:hypothetical protein